MAVFDFLNRRPSAPATQKQVQHITELISQNIIQSGTEEGDAFIIVALDFVKAYRKDAATNGMYADCITLYNDYRRAKRT